MMTIHFNANLRPVVGERVGMLHWIMDPVAAGFIIAYDLEGNQVLISNFDVSLWVQFLFVSSLADSHFPGGKASSRKLERRSLSLRRYCGDWSQRSVRCVELPALASQP